MRGSAPAGIVAAALHRGRFHRGETRERVRRGERRRRAEPRAQRGGVRGGSRGRYRGGETDADAEVGADADADADVRRLRRSEPNGDGFAAVISATAADVRPEPNRANHRARAKPPRAHRRVPPPHRLLVVIRLEKRIRGRRVPIRVRIRVRVSMSRVPIPDVPVRRESSVPRAEHQRGDGARRAVSAPERVPLSRRVFVLRPSTFLGVVRRSNLRLGVREKRRRAGDRPDERGDVSSHAVRLHAPVVEPVRAETRRAVAGYRREEMTPVPAETSAPGG